MIYEILGEAIGGFVDGLFGGWGDRRRNRRKKRYGRKH